MLWTGNESNLDLDWMPESARRLTLGNDTINATDAVRVLGVVVMPDLSLDKHVTAVSSKCFFQLCRVRRSLDDESVAMVVHAFVMSHIYYCNDLLAGAPKVVTDKLQRVMNSAAWVITNTRKFDHGLSHVQREILHWLDVPEHVTFKQCLSVYKCLHGMRPPYLSEMCRPISSFAGYHHLCSAFSFAGPLAWNGLLAYIPKRRFA